MTKRADGCVTVGEVLQFLKQFPEDAIAYAYEGEDCGIVVVGAYVDPEMAEWGGHHELGFLGTGAPRD